MKTRYLLGVKLNYDLTVDEVLFQCEKLIQKNEKAYICTVNPEFIVDASSDINFRDTINESFISVIDGNGILIVLHTLDTLEKIRKYIPFRIVRQLLFMPVFLLSGIYAMLDKLPAKVISGVSLSWNIMNLSAQKHYSAFLLGGRYSNELPISQLAADNIKCKYPDIRIVGYSSSFSYKEFDDVASVDSINSSLFGTSFDSVNFLLVAYGHKKQEYWIKRNISQIDANVCIGVGGTFDYMSHAVKYAPNFIRSVKLEWLYRLICEPKRIHRIYRALILFPLKSIKEVR